MRKFVMLLVVSLVVFSAPAFSYDLSRYLDQEVANLAYFSPSISTRAAAIRTLGMRDYRPSIPYLLGLCSDGNLEIRTASIMALGMMRVPQAVTTFQTIIWDRSNSYTLWDKFAAVKAMANYPDLDVRLLMDVFEYHPDMRVAIVAAKSLQRRPEYEARSAIILWEPLLKMVP